MILLMLNVALAPAGNQLSRIVNQLHFRNEQNSLLGKVLKRHRWTHFGLGANLAL